MTSRRQKPRGGSDAPAMASSVLKGCSRGRDAEPLPAITSCCGGRRFVMAGIDPDDWIARRLISSPRASLSSGRAYPGSAWCLDVLLVPYPSRLCSSDPSLPPHPCVPVPPGAAVPWRGFRYRLTRFCTSWYTCAPVVAWSLYMMVMGGQLGECKLDFSEGG